MRNALAKNFSVSVTSFVLVMCIEMKHLHLYEMFKYKSSVAIAKFAD